MHGRTSRCLSACVALSVAFLVARRLHAQDLGPTLLVYRAPDGCPTVFDFRIAVQRRSARLRFVEQGAHERVLSIAMRREGEATHGELRLVERDGRTSQRSVRFSTCSEALEGLAMIAVVSLDPQALLEAPKAEQPASVVAGEAPAREAKTARKQDSAAPGSAPAKPRSKARLALGGLFNVAPSALPATALGGSLLLDVESTSPSHFAPLLRVAVSHFERRGLASDGGAEANFRLTLATVSACPWHFPVSLVDFRPCAFVNGGVLYAWGSQTTNTQQRTRPYGALGGSLSVLARVSQVVDIVADIALGSSLVRDSFGFEQDQPWQTPALYLSSGIGARFAFP
ncbi:MAG TPA: hypothetical protein VFK05_39745 [Polyangiaceae bacterium]|nr:hypothetical protein [Polyangiaceae bacterium]